VNPTFLVDRSVELARDDEADEEEVDGRRELRLRIDFVEGFCSYAYSLYTGYATGWE